jgi:hypothetical protein
LCHRTAYHTTHRDFYPAAHTQLEWNPPILFFHRDGGVDLHNQFYGIELETDGYDGAISDAIRKLKDIRMEEGRSGKGPTFWLKSDGSLRHGIEIAYHPRSTASWLYYLNNDFLRVRSIVEAREGKSFHAGTCGLHIHRSVEDVDLDIKCKLAMIFTHCKSALYKVAQRKDCSYASYQIFRRRTYNDYVQAFRRNEMEGRHAIAFSTGHETMEFRLFKGTLAPHTIGAQICFVDSIIEYCKQIDMATIDKLCEATKVQIWDDYLGWVSKSYKNPLYPWLAALLCRKGYFTIATADYTPERSILQDVAQTKMA